MEDNNDLKIEIKKISKLEGGRFQNMCNQILDEMGYIIHPLGSHDESDKTTPGTPDTFYLKDDCYTLVEYTTQEDRIFQKIKDDVEKCIKKIKECKIEKGKIIEFYTSSNLKIEEFKELNDLCLSENIMFKIYNIDMIANLLRKEYPLIAKEYLGIAVDTLQVLSPFEYMKEYNMKKGSVNINDELLYREDEKNEVLQNITDNDITLISGKSGCGKTHLILDIMINDKSQLNEYKILCIKNRNQNLFDDLKKHLKKDNKYIIFIDDINNINDIGQILYFLNPINNLELKIVATVRDYAKSKVIKKIKTEENETDNCFKIGYIDIKQLTDEQLGEVIKKNTSIKNDLIIRNIIYVSQGNARILMMASNVIESGTGKTTTIEDIYNSYYDSAVKQLSEESSTIMKSLAAISFLNAIDLKNDNHKSLITLFNLTENQLRKDMLILHDNEIIDMIDDDIAKISEQCISNYSMYLSVIIKKDISVENLVINMYLYSKSRLIEDINLLLNVFHNQEIIDLIKSGISQVWNTIDTYKYDKFDFLDSFGSLLDFETLDFCSDFVKTINCNKMNFKYDEIITSKNREYPDNKLLNLLGKFKYSDKMELALNIIIEYIKKDNGIIPEAYKLFAYMWGYGEEIYYSDFHIQEKVVESLISSNNPENESITYLIMNLIQHYLKFSGDYSFSSGKRNIVITQYCLNESDNLRKFRNTMFDYLIEKSKNENNKDILINILNYLYSSGYGRDENIKLIMENDFDKVNVLVNNLLPLDFKIAILTENINKEYKAFNVSNLDINIQEDIYEYYKMIDNNIDHDYKNDNTIENMKKIANQMNVNEIYENINKIGIIENEKLLENKYDIGKGISSFIIALFGKEEIDVCKLLDLFIGNNLLKNFPIERIIKLCIDKVGYSKTKQIISKYEYTKKPYFMFACYSLIPDKEICKKELDSFIEFISQKITIKSGTYINLEFLERYISVDKNIYPKILNIICDLYKDDLFVLSLMTSLLFNEYSENTPEKLTEYFKSDYDVLIKAYLLLKDRDNLDYHGKYFDMFMNLDFKNFINKYLNFIDNNPDIMHNNHKALENIWKHNDEKIRYVIESMLKINNFKRTNFLKLIFSNSKDNYDIEERYLIDIIKNYSDNDDILTNLFIVISNRSKEGRIKCIIELLTINNNYELFEKLQLESHSWSCSGSEIPLIESRIDYFKELMESIQKLGSNYIKHCMLINEKIKLLEKYKRDTVRNEFLREW